MSVYRTIGPLVYGYLTPMIQNSENLHFSKRSGPATKGFSVVNFSFSRRLFFTLNAVFLCFKLIKRSGTK